ncbi:G-protein coupled adenosine receptor activity protein [Homalodisca vitripennis]|nr:G-protein coupled adenosine receptor activity protein [Homalodisca vitripennis]
MFIDSQAPIHVSYGGTCAIIELVYANIEMIFKFMGGDCSKAYNFGLDTARILLVTHLFFFLRDDCNDSYLHSLLATLLFGKHKRELLPTLKTTNVKGGDCSKACNFGLDTARILLVTHLSFFLRDDCNLHSLLVVCVTPISQGLVRVTTISQTTPTQTNKPKQTNPNNTNPNNTNPTTPNQTTPNPKTTNQTTTNPNNNKPNNTKPTTPPNNTNPNNNKPNNTKPNNTKPNNTKPKPTTTQTTPNNQQQTQTNNKPKQQQTQTTPNPNNNKPNQPNPKHQTQHTKPKQQQTKQQQYPKAVFPVTGIICVCWVAGGIVGFLPLFGWYSIQSEISYVFFEEVMLPQFLISYTSNSSFCPAVFPVTGIICVCWVAGGIVGFLPLFGWYSIQSEISYVFFEEVMSPQFLISYTSNSSFCPAVFPVTGIICVCWVAGGIVGFLPLFGWNNVQGEISSCFFEEVMSPQFLVFLYFATIIGPATVMAAFYTHIYTVVLKQVSTILFQTPILKRVLEHCWKIKNPPEFSEFDRNLKKKLASQRSFLQ